MLFFKFVLLALSATLVAAGGCLFAPLPDNLNTPAFLGSRDEVSFQGTFQTDYSVSSQNIFFNVTTASFFRAYVSPLPLDVDLWLHTVPPDNTKTPVHSTLDIDTPETIATLLQPGAYRLRIDFIGFFVYDLPETLRTCPTLQLELAIVPQNTFQGRVSTDAACAVPGQQFPTIDFSPLLTSSSFVYDGSLNKTNNNAWRFKQENWTPLPAPEDVMLINRYRIEVPASHSATYWFIEVVLGVDFMSGGQYGVLLTTHDPHQQAGVKLPGGYDCLGNSSCVIGTARYNNEKFLKRLVSPGVYDLWLYERPSERVKSLTQQCTPFTLRVMIEESQEKETFVTCPAAPLPSSLSLDTQFGIDTSYAEGERFSSQILIDFSNPEQITRVDVKQLSILRAYADGGPVDVDLRLKDINTGKTIISSLSAGDDDLYAEIEAGSYNVTFKSFGDYEPTSCQTFQAVLQVESLAHAQDEDYCSRVSLQSPDLKDINVKLSAGQPYNSDPTHVFAVTSNTTEIATTTFTVPSNTSAVFYARAEHNFLFAPLMLQLSAQGKPSDSASRSLMSLDAATIDAILEPGTYSFSIELDKTHKPSSSSHLPSCAVFSLDLHVHKRDPISLDDQSDCWRIRTLPSTLQTPAHLLTSRSAHLADNFKVEFEANQLKYSEWMHIGQVPVKSLLRVVTSHSHIDLDVYLYNAGSNVSVDHSDSFDNNWESILFELDPSVDYKLKFVYYHWSHQSSGGVDDVDPPCFSFRLELAIEPTSYVPAPAPGQLIGSCMGGDHVLPGYTVEVEDDFDLDSAYRFAQSSQTLKTMQTLFVLDDASLFRATLSFDFIWHHLHLELYAAGNISALDDTSKTAPWRDNLVASGVAIFNGNNIGPLQLSAGSYVLVVRELRSHEAASVTSCARFRLHVGARSLDVQSGRVAVDPSEVELLRCSESRLGVAFDDVSHLSTRSGYRMHVFRQVLANKGNDELVEFQLTQESVFRLRAPLRRLFWLSIKLYNGTRDNLGARVNALGGFAAHELLARLASGPYVLKISYLGRSSSLGEEDCPQFPLELAIEPIDSLKSLPALNPNGGCGDVPTLPQLTSANLKGFSQKAVAHPLDKLEKITVELGEFNITKTTFLDASLDFDFLSGSLAWHLSGKLPRGSIGRYAYKTFDGSFGQGRALMQQVLLPGSYKLEILAESGSKTAFQGAATCSPFDVSVATRTNNLPAYDCYNGDSLPSSAASYYSWAYGGPQDEDGEVVLFGDNFLLDGSDDASVDQYMDFVVKEASYVRFFVGAGDTDDIDFFLYKNSSLDELIGSSNSVGASESKLFFLQPQSDAYTLNLFFFYVDPQPPCRRFTFEMALRTVSTVHNELLCPNPLPNAALRVPPTSYRFDSTKQYGSDLYFFTSDLIESNTTSSFFSRTFRYRMDVSAPTGAIVKATVGFDFLVNDFKLELIDADTSVRVASSTRRPADDRSTYANFQSQLEYTLERGKNYHLDIIEDRSDLALKLENQTYCHKFAFHIDAGVSSTSDRAPHVFWVTPSSGEDINPLEPLAMSIYLSKGLKYDASVDPPLLFTIIANQAVYLQDEKTGAKIMAHTADVTRNNRRIHVTFNNGTLNIASTYKLHVNLNGPAFRSDESPPREFEAYTVEHTYKTVECDCNAPHGSCVKGENKYVCKCVAPFEGEDCKACGKGYHSAVTGCVADTKCTPSFCGEKGTCDDSRGYPQCQCHTGFATVGDEHCRACARGYWGHFPDCRKIGESLSRPPRCQAPLLPSTLNGIGGLGYDGQVHLQGDYYIDTLNYEHDITFTISIQSVFRVYVARHRIDIDIWLYELDSVGNIVDVVESGVGFGTEESIFLLLNGLRNQPKKYLLRFQYFDFGDFDLFGDIAESSGSGSDSTDCESFSFELAVVPVPNVADETLLSSKCVEKENLPLPALPNNTLTIEKDYSYAPNDYFTINALPTAAVDNTKARYAWERKIEIKEVEGQIAVLRASMRYRFAVGDLAFLLEHGDDVCKTKTAKEGNVNEEQDDDNVDFDDDELLDKTRCAVGTNHRNMHTIEQKLEPGVYTLRIYEPRPQLYTMTKCSVFHFELQVTYEKASESIFTCPGVQLPPNFNSPAYLAQADGQMHLVDTFSLNRYQRVEFELEKDSLFRWHSNGDAARVVLHGDRRFATLTDGVDTSDSNGVYARLGAGNYSISISRRVYNTFCPSLVGELAIAPYKFPTCAGNAGIPSLSVTALPFRFNGTDSNGVPTTFNTRLSTSTTIASYPFELGEAADLRAELSNDFLTANMLLAVYHVADSLGTLAHIANGRNNYNHNTLRLLLAPGKYQLAIEIPARATVDTAPPYASCADFNFMFHLLPVHADAVDDCLAYRGEAEELPTTLDGARYFAAGKRDRIHFQSDQFLIPPAALNRFWHEHYINFTAPASGESLLRIYAEPRNDNDVDLKLFQDKIQVATASNRVYGDETFTARLSPGKNYRLRITFWSADNSAQRCPTFGMSVDIEPVHRLLPRTCPQGGDHLPPAPKTMAVPSEYDSRRPSTSSRDPEHLHLQQTVQPKSFQWNFTLEASADLFFEVGYDFLLGDLAMSLTPLEQTAATVYGKNGRDRNVLRVEDAAPGDYSLTIAEPTIHTDDVIGCNEFTFRYVAQEARPPPSAVVGLIPTDLNGVDGLGGSNRLFISGEFALTGLERGSRSRDSAITVKKQSVLRVEYDAGRGSWITASVFKKGMGAEHPIANVTRETGRKLPMVLQALLAPGDYVLQFKNRFSFISFSSTRGVATTLSIEPTSVIARANEDNFQLQCMTRYIDEPMLNAAGAYHKKYTDLLANLDQISHEKPLQSVEFVVKNESAVYFRVEYPFPAYVLSLQVIDQKRNSTLYVGSVGQNSAELSQYLKTGTYTLQVVQPEPLPSTWSSVTNLLPQCARYELSIQIDDAANSGAPVDCTAYDTLPASLNSFGITPYGSQLVPAVGHLRLYSDKFYFGGNDGNGAETTSFKITRDSVVAIYTNNDAFTDVDFQLSLQTSSTAMAPRFVSTNGYEKQLIWYIKAGEYELSIEYEGIGLEKCQNIALQILIRPFDELNAQMVCSKDTGNKAALPNKPPNPLPINFHTGLTTRLTPDYLNAHVDKEGNFAYDLDFSVAKDATVHASLAFNSLISGFELEIRSRSNGRDSFLSSGNGHPLGLSALETTLSSTLARPLFPGDYTLRIKQPRQNHTWTLGMPFDTDTMHSLCLPLMVDVCVGPAESSYLRFDPPGAQLLPIGQTLDIIVHLPEAVTNDVGVPYSAANVNKKSIQKLFKLSGNDNKPDVELKSVEYVTNVEVVGSQWKLSYEIGPNEQGRTLHLEMIAKMFDLTRNPVLMCGTPEFSTVNTKCSGHGQYINDICKCEQGWAGDECQLCDTDYEDDGSGKCVKIEGGGCRHTTCQCEPGTYGVDCVPLGVCGVKAGQPTCTCRSVGLDNKSRCRHCAPGYRNWPVCSKCVDGEPCADTVPTPMPIVPGVPTPMPSIVPTASNTATSSKAPNAKSSGGGSGGVIAGVIIAVLLLIGAGVGFYFYRKKKGGYTRVGGGDDMFDLEGHTMGSDKSVQLRSDSPDLL